MSWIEETELPDVPAIFQAMSLKPAALDVVRRLNEVLSFGGSGLSRVQEEAIATVISVVNRSRYGALTHAGFFQHHSKNPKMASHLLGDYTQANLPLKDRRMLDFAVRVTREPGSLTEDAVQTLRDAGMGEEQILSVVLIACLCNFMDRLANSLGVDLDSRYRQVLDSWLSETATEQNWLTRPPGHQPEGASVDIHERSASDLKNISEESSAITALGTAETLVDRGVETEHSPADTVPGPAETPVDGAIGPEDTPAGPVPGAAETQFDSGGTLELEIEPPTVEATAITLERFIKECCRTGAGEATTTRDLYIAYLRWCDENGQQPWRQRDFGVNLTALGYQRQRRGHRRYWWSGIGLATAEEIFYTEPQHESG